MQTRSTLSSIIQGRSLALSLTLLFSLALAGCDGPGELLSNDRVVDADNNQVVFIGDSIFALSGEEQDFIEEDLNQSFRRYTLSGAELTGGFVATAIVDQYATARSDNADIETVVMDGGGNDILIPAIALDPYRCKTRWYRFGRLSSKCRSFIDDVYVEAVNFLNDMHADGVEQVIYQGYYYTKNGLFRLENMKEAVDYGNLRLAQACNRSAVDCTFVDPRDAISNSDIIFDGIHPTTSGSRKLADLVVPVLQPAL